MFFLSLMLKLVKMLKNLNFKVKKHDKKNTKFIREHNRIVKEIINFIVKIYNQTEVQIVSLIYLKN